MSGNDMSLIYEALRFFVWAAGEGLCPIDDIGPEQVLLEYTLETGDDDWDGLPERIASRMGK